MNDFPLTPAEAIAVAAPLTTHPNRLPHWQEWAVKLRDWGRAELARPQTTDPDATQEEAS
jgi:hypothetical protein